jgi:alkylation response protein AidB-like acyl-CoA dehydrogenase
VDTRDTPEQAELRSSARRLARELGPKAVPDLDDAERRARLAAAVRSAGWLELRIDAGDGVPVAGGVETAIVGDALGAAVADVAFAGPALAADLVRRAGANHVDDAVVAFGSSLTEIALVAGKATSECCYAVDAAGEPLGRAFVLVPDESGFGLGAVALDAAEPPSGADLTRAVREIPAGTPVELVTEQARALDADDLAAWSALGLALTSADLVGAMRGVIAVTVEYATERRQFGVPVGTFQAVQHLLADAACLMEASTSTALHASWAVDNLSPAEALRAARTAKAYCARAARTVCEHAIQVHGGIGNTWECMVHVFLRRALLSSQWFGDDGVQLSELQRDLLGVG